MHDNFSQEEKVRGLVGSVLATVGAVFLGIFSTPDGGTLTIAYFGGAILFGALAVSFLLALW
jgi:hypothetical protein